jgi:hypothetical protein
MMKNNLNNTKNRARATTRRAGIKLLPWSLVMIVALATAACGEDDGKGKDTGFALEIGENGNMPSDGKLIVQYNDVQEGTDFAKLLDGNRATEVVSPHTTFYMIWAGTASVAVNAYSLVAGNADQQHDPRAWTLSGSRDNSNWISLDRREEEVFEERQGVNRYTLTNTTRFKYYKLEITANNGGTTTRIAEWSLQIPDENLDVSDLIAAYSTGPSHSAITPMGKHYENRVRTTDAIKTWLLDPTNEPPMPAHLKSHEWRAFPVTLFPAEKPRPADVNQHGIGDCGAAAALASMAYQNPDFVQSLIVDNGDNSYTVSMFDPLGEPVRVRVSNKFCAQNSKLITASGKGTVATWSTVLEKAIIKYNAQYKANVDIGGIGAEHVTPLFTGDGNSIAFKPRALTRDELTRVVKSSLLQGKFVLGGFSQGGIQADGGKTVKSHVFTAMHSTKLGAMFAMRNPWGGNQNVANGDDGVMHIFSDTDIPDLIDLRIIDPGLSGTDGNTEPYVPPVGN